jgi:membrane protein YdbS with pleckstrin-like domain
VLVLAASSLFILFFLAAAANCVLLLGATATSLSFIFHLLVEPAQTRKDVWEDLVDAIAPYFMMIA